LGGGRSTVILEREGAFTEDSPDWEESVFE
jgi:hypothetical protein